MILKTELHFTISGRPKPTIKYYYGGLGFIDGLIEYDLTRRNKHFTSVKFKVRLQRKVEIVVDSDNKV